VNKRLTPHERRAIARLADAGVPRLTLARAFGVTAPCIDHIKRGYWMSGHGNSNVRGVSVPLAPEFRNTPWSRA
jgi:hypothetical protein